MSRYVDIEPLENALKAVEKRGEVAVLLDELISVIAKYPAADVAKVVRCKECKHRGYQYRDYHGTEKVVCWKYGYGIQKNANGYCDDWDFRDEKDGEQNG